MVSDEGCFPFISLFDIDIVIPLSEINLGKQFHSLYSSNEFWYQWDGVAIFDCPFVELSIVLHWA